MALCVDGNVEHVAEHLSFVKAVGHEFGIIEYFGEESRVVGMTVFERIAVAFLCFIAEFAGNGIGTVVGKDRLGCARVRGRSSVTLRFRWP